MRHLKGLAGTFSLIVRPRTTARQLLGAWPALHELVAEEPASETSLDRVVGSRRNLALIRSTVAQVRRIGRADNASVNDVLLAVIAGGLRTVLLKRGEPVDHVTVRIYVPVSLRGRLRGAVQGNRISQMVVPIPLSVPDPRLRLQRIARETAMRKARKRPSLGTIFQLGIVSRLMLKLIIRQRVNVTSASIPGPRRPLYLAGAEVLEVFPLLNLFGNEPLGVGALSYAGTFNIGVVADRDAYPDIDVFAAGVREDLRALGMAANAMSSRPGVSAALGPQVSVAETAVA